MNDRIFRGAVVAFLLVAVLWGGGCAKMTAYDPATGNKVYESSRFLQKSELKRAKAGSWDVEGWRNDGGAAALENITAMAMQYMGMAGQLQTAGLNAQIAALKAQLDAATSTTSTPTTPVVTTTATPTTAPTSTSAGAASVPGDDVEFE